jgi:hypothetical protein
MTNYSPTPSMNPGRRATRRRRWWRPAPPVALLLLGLVFASALLAPIPAGPNAARAEVVDRVESKLPGWSIVRTDSSWEGAWSVVAACGDDRLGFQVVPGHGLAPGDAWIQPEDGYSRARLRSVSDHTTYLVWFQGHRGRSLPCRSELARPQGEATRGGFFD